MAYSITNLDTGHALSFGGVTVAPGATQIVTEDRLASLGAGGIAFFNQKAAAGLASVSYLGYTAPAPDSAPAGSKPVTPVSGTYSQAANPIPLDVRYTSPFGQALVLAASSAAAVTLLGIGSATTAATTTTLGAVKQGTALTPLTDSTGGTVSTTLATGITDAVAKNAIASLNAQINNLYNILKTAGITL